MIRVSLNKDAHTIWFGLKDRLPDSSLIGLLSVVVDAQTYREELFILPRLDDNHIDCGFKYWAGKKR